MPGMRAAHGWARCSAAHGNGAVSSPLPPQPPSTPTPPIAARIPALLPALHGDRRPSHYRWMADPSRRKAAPLLHLKAENDYARKVCAGLAVPQVLLVHALATVPTDM